VVADAEQIIHVSIDKDCGHKFCFIAGGIENNNVNISIVNVLEGDNARISEINIIELKVASFKYFVI